MIRFLEFAKIDFAEAVSFYDSQEQDLGQSFITEVKHELSLLSVFPQARQIYLHDVRRSHIKRFPYAILYFVEEGDIIVVGIQHLKADPIPWIERIRELNDNDSHD